MVSAIPLATVADGPSGPIPSFANTRKEANRSNDHDEDDDDTMAEADKDTQWHYDQPSVEKVAALAPEHDDDDDDDAGSDKSKKKRKKKKTKARKTQASSSSSSIARLPSKLPPVRGVAGFTDSYVTVGQTEPPSIPVATLFADAKFPVGEIQDHPGDFNTYRTSSAEKRARERAEEDLYEKVRCASEVHRHVRKFAQGLMKPPTCKEVLSRGDDY